MTARLVFVRLLPVWAILAALLAGMVLVRLAGADPVQAYLTLLRGAFTDVFGLATTLVKTAPLLLAGLGVAVPLRAGLFNIGAEGQIYLGGLAAALVGLFVQGLPGVLHVTLAVVAAFAAGALWALAPALLKVSRGVNEVITTLLLNYVAVFLVSALVSGPLMEPGAPYPQSRPLEPSAGLPVILPGTDAHVGILIGLACAVLMHVLFTRTSHGFRLRAVGVNPSAAAYAGINVNRTLIAAMLVGGGLAGLAGAGEVVGLKHRLFEGFSPGYGYDAIVVAFLGGGQALGTVVMAFFFGALRSGANIMQRAVGVPVAIVFAVQGLAVLFLAASLVVQQRARIRVPLVEASLVKAPAAEGSGPGGSG